MDGPRNLERFIRDAAPLLMERHLKDNVDAIKDAATWTLSRIVKMHHKTVLHLAEPILLAFASVLQSSPRVAASACWVWNFQLDLWEMLMLMCRVCITWPIPLKARITTPLNATSPM